MIQIGQDALGGWAWMLFDGRGRLISSGDRLSTMERAVDDAGEAFVEAKIRGELNLLARPRFTFPDA